MRDVEINDPYILERLNGFLESFNKLDIEKSFKMDNRDPSIDKVYGTSEEYLKKMRVEGHVGYPMAIKGIDILAHPTKKDGWGEIEQEVSYEFGRELGAQQNALCCYYPSDGFIGWHDNHDAPGHTLLFTWSATGDGYYRYRDIDTGEVKTLPDRAGWICRTGEYGDGKAAPEQWHCAATNEPRWSIAFYVRSKAMIDMIVEDLEYPDS